MIDVQPRYLAFNLNAYVRVKLTEHGREMLRQRADYINKALHDRGCDARVEYDDIAEDADGWSEWQLWDLMHKFGDHVSHGTVHMPFETDMQIVLKNPIDGSLFKTT